MALEPTHARLRSTGISIVDGDDARTPAEGCAAKAPARASTSRGAGPDELDLDVLRSRRSPPRRLPGPPRPEAQSATVRRTWSASTMSSTFATSDDAEHRLQPARDVARVVRRPEQDELRRVLADELAEHVGRRLAGMTPRRRRRRTTKTVAAPYAPSVAAAAVLPGPSATAATSSSSDRAFASRLERRRRRRARRDRPPHRPRSRPSATPPASEQLHDPRGRPRPRPRRARRPRFSGAISIAMTRCVGRTSSARQGRDRRASTARRPSSSPRCSSLSDGWRASAAPAVSVTSAGRSQSTES